MNRLIAALAVVLSLPTASLAQGNRFGAFQRSPMYGASVNPYRSALNGAVQSSAASPLQNQLLMQQQMNAMQTNAMQNALQTNALQNAMQTNALQNALQANAMQANAMQLYGQNSLMGQYPSYGMGGYGYGNGMGMGMMPQTGLTPGKAMLVTAGTVMGGMLVTGAVSNIAHGLAAAHAQKAALAAQSAAIAPPGSAARYAPEKTDNPIKKAGRAVKKVVGTIVKPL